MTRTVTRNPCAERFDTVTTTSRTYAPVLLGADVVFTAPDDGRAVILSRCEIGAENDAFDHVIHSLEVRTGSTVVVAPSDLQAFVVPSRHGCKDPVTTRVTLPIGDLSPGRQYTVRQMFRVTAGSATLGPRRVEVVVNVPDPRQPAYDAVYKAIRGRGADAPLNAFTWRCVHAALNAVNVGVPVDPETGQGPGPLPAESGRYYTRWIDDPREPIRRQPPTTYMDPERRPAVDDNYPCQQPCCEDKR